MQETRIRNLRRLISERYEGKQKRLANAAGVSLSQLGQWLSGNRNMSERSARKIEKAINLPVGWLDGQKQEPLQPASSGRAGGDWPFSFSLERFMQLSALSRAKIDGYLLRMIEEEERDIFIHSMHEANALSFHEKRISKIEP